MNKIDAILRKQVEENKTPSVQFIFFDKINFIHQYRFGFADIGNQISVSAKTAYNLYSVTKTFTALAVLQLADQKKLEIDHPVKKYLADFPYPSEITIRQLLTHTSGIPNPIPLGWIHPINESLHFDRNNFFRQIFLRFNKLNSKPGDKYAYSNLGYVLLGFLIEKVTGLSYETYIQEYIIKRMKLEEDDLNFKIIPAMHHAKGYHKKFSFSNVLLGVFIDKSKFMAKTEGRWNLFNDFYINGVSYGGLIGTSLSMVKYIRELLMPDCNLISENYKKMLFTENHTNTGKSTGMCLSWFKGQLNGNQYFTHAGGGGGYYCEIRIYPDLGLGSLIMFNRTGMSDERFLDKLDKYFLS